MFYGYDVEVKPGRKIQMLSNRRLTPPAIDWELVHEFPSEEEAKSSPWWKEKRVFKNEDGTTTTYGG